jgi:eukaryotic-like serine/threonine-protein kinase
MRRSYTINFSIPVSTFWGIVVPLLVLAVAGGMLCGVLVVDRLIMPTVVGVNRGLIPVPSVVNMPSDQARDKLLGVGLRWDIKSREYSDGVPQNSVISQFPAAGDEVKKGRQVDAVVSKGPKTDAVPDVKKLNDRQARIELRKHGFDIGRIRRTYDDSVTKDLAIKSVPEKGTIISKEMTVDLVLSNGPKPTSAEVPNIVGESIESARAKVEDSGLSMGAMTYANNASVEPGTVMSQSFSPGTSVPLESKIDIVVSVKK